MQVLHINLFAVDKGDNQISESWQVFALADCMIRTQGKIVISSLLRSIFNKYIINFKI